MCAPALKDLWEFGGRDGVCDVVWDWEALAEYDTEESSGVFEWMGVLGQMTWRAFSPLWFRDGPI